MRAGAGSSNPGPGAAVWGWHFPCGRGVRLLVVPVLLPDHSCGCCNREFLPVCAPCVVSSTSTDKQAFRDSEEASINAFQLIFLTTAGRKRKD